MILSTAFDISIAGRWWYTEVYLPKDVIVGRII
jgi:hypothetical protein